MTRSTLLLASMFATLALAGCQGGEIAGEGTDRDSGPSPIPTSSGGGSAGSSSGNSSSGGPIATGPCAIPAAAPHDPAAKPVVLANVSTAPRPSTP